MGGGIRAEAVGIVGAEAGSVGEAEAVEAARQSELARLRQ